MIKNQLYPYIEQYINDLLHGFTKEQFDVGVMNGEIKLEKLNLRPDGANKILDDKNYSFWLKAGFITKIYIGCSIMNFIGEKPLDVVIEGVDIIMTPSYKWIIKNLDSFIIENIKQIEIPYDPNENNSMDIFERKVNVVDNSVFKKESIVEIFKDGTKISQLINNLFRYCFKFYYMNNFLVNAKIKNHGVGAVRTNRVDADGVTAFDKVEIEIIFAFHFIVFLFAPYMVGSGLFFHNDESVAADIVGYQFVFLFAKIRISVRVASGSNQR